MPLVCPEPIKPGEVIGVAAPAGPFQVDRFQQGLDRLTAMGFQVKTPEQIYDRKGFLAGTDQSRAQTFNHLLADPDVRMIIAARGGYGVMRILDRIDYDLLREHPKIIAGFSDLTALLLTITQKAGLITFHGPVVTHLAAVDEPSVAQFQRLVTGQKAFPLSLEQTKTLVPGRAQGPLLGGNLTLIVHMLAAGRLPDLSGSILFLEDVQEAPYRLDRLLVTLKLAGVFDRVKGVILGEFNGCGEPEEISGIIRDYLNDLGKPVVLDFPIGHGQKNLTLPVGADAVLDTAAGILDVPDAAGTRPAGL